MRDTIATLHFEPRPDCLCFVWTCPDGATGRPMAHEDVPNKVETFVLAYTETFGTGTQRRRKHTQ